MDFESYTERARGFVQSAFALALRSNHQRLTPEHMLKVLLEDKQGLATNLVRAAGGNPEQALAAVEAELNKLPRVEGSGAGQPQLTPEVARLFDNAQKIAEKAGDKYVTAERLLLAIALEAGTPAAKALASAGVNAQALNQTIEQVRKGRTADSPNAAAVRSRAYFFSAS